MSLSPVAPHDEFRSPLSQQLPVTVQCLSEFLTDVSKYS